MLRPGALGTSGTAGSFMLPPRLGRNPASQAPAPVGRPCPGGQVSRESPLSRALAVRQDAGITGIHPAPPEGQTLPGAAGSAVSRFLLKEYLYI